ncbi:MAG: methyltransferase [Verrucomicrobia bacterium]|nr:MAG: methyltransferase [Verrucomicrobiota bacterium]
MTSKERITASIEHRQPDRVPVDFGSSFITGIHCSVVEELRRHYGLEKRPVKVCEPYQMLGEVEEDLLEAMGCDVQPIFPQRTIFGFPNEDWQSWQTPWGQEVLVSGHFQTTTDAEGNITLYPEGDREAPASGLMPRTGYFFDTIERIDPGYDEDKLQVEDNLEEFGPMSAREEIYWTEQAKRWKDCPRAISVHLNGTCLGDIALVPAPFLKQPKGVRGVADWYMLTAANPAHVAAIFDRQTEIALRNLDKLASIAGDTIDVVVVCGTDFGTQTSLFCGVPKVREIWLPHYRRINDWIHQNTKWKTFKHSCGAVEPLIETFINSGFDILNPVQCSAEGMDPGWLKEKYGSRITFWGGGVNTQQTLPFGSPEEVRREVLERCRIFGPGGGFVFNAIHNLQALSPLANVVAMLEAVREYNGN